MASFDKMKNNGNILLLAYYFDDVTADELALQLGTKFPEALKDQEIDGLARFLLSLAIIWCL